MKIKLATNWRWVGPGLVGIGLVGYLIVHLTRAAGPFVSLEPEQGQVTAPATVVSDQLASGQAVRFGAATLADNFDGTDGLITDYHYYQSAAFPSGGTSTATNPSAVWEGDSGSFFRQGGWGYSGRPADWRDRFFFRFNTRRFDFGDAAVSWQYRSAPFGQDGYPVDGADAVDVWLRYQTQYNLYTFQFDRTNNGVYVKRKVPAQGWSGPANLVSNLGVYYIIPTDVDQPIFGANHYLITWNGVQNLLPASERAKPAFPNLAHDSTTTYDFKVTARNVAGGKVQFQAYRAGALIYSATDDGRSGLAANNETQGTHLDRGYFNTVTGWKPEWGLPVTAPGATGFRADNIKFWVDNFVAASL